MNSRVVSGLIAQMIAQEPAIGDVDAQSPRWFRLGQRRIGLRVVDFGVGSASGAAFGANGAEDGS